MNKNSALALVAEWKTIRKGKGTVACICPVEAIVLRTLRSGAILGGGGPTIATADCKGGTTVKGVDSEMFIQESLSKEIEM